MSHFDLNSLNGGGNGANDFHVGGSGTFHGSGGTDYHIGGNIGSHDGHMGGSVSGGFTAHPTPDYSIGIHGSYGTGDQWSIGATGSIHF